jgi:hypothetical protein
MRTLRACGHTHNVSSDAYCGVSLRSRESPAWRRAACAAPPQIGAAARASSCGAASLAAAWSARRAAQPQAAALLRTRREAGEGKEAQRLQHAQGLPHANSNAPHSSTARVVASSDAAHDASSSSSSAAAAAPKLPRPAPSRSSAPSCRSSGQAGALCSAPLHSRHSSSCCSAAAAAVGAAADCTCGCAAGVSACGGDGEP